MQKLNVKACYGDLIYLSKKYLNLTYQKAFSNNLLLRLAKHCDLFSAFFDVAKVCLAPKTVNLCFLATLPANKENKTITWLNDK